jgi:hypothetical protein
MSRSIAAPKIPDPEALELLVCTNGQFGFRPVRFLEALKV